MDFYSSVSGILVVHISDYSGKLCLSAGLERENDLRSSYKKFYIAVLIGFPFSFLNLFCVHLMFRGGKYNPSEISALNVFTMFWTNHRAYSDHMYYLWHYGYVLLCNILLFPQPKNGIFCKYIFLAD